MTTYLDLVGEYFLGFDVANTWANLQLWNVITQNVATGDIGLPPGFVAINSYPPTVQPQPNEIGADPYGNRYFFVVDTNAAVVTPSILSSAIASATANGQPAPNVLTVLISISSQANVNVSNTSSVSNTPTV